MGFLRGRKRDKSMKRQKNILAIWAITAIILTGSLVGGGVYYWHREKAESEKNELQMRIRKLQDQVFILERGMIKLSARGNLDYVLKEILLAKI
jgi:hypothetical protein